MAETGVQQPAQGNQAQAPQPEQGQQPGVPAGAKTPTQPAVAVVAKPIPPAGTQQARRPDGTFAGGKPGAADVAGAGQSVGGSIPGSDHPSASRLADGDLPPGLAPDDYVDIDEERDQSTGIITKKGTQGLPVQASATGADQPAGTGEPDVTPVPDQPPTTEQPPADQPVDPAAVPFVFGKETFKDRAAAEHSFMTLRGNFKSAIDKARDAEAQLNGIRTELTNTDFAGRKWQERALALTSAIARLTGKSAEEVHEAFNQGNDFSHVAPAQAGQQHLAARTPASQAAAPNAGQQPSAGDGDFLDKAVDWNVYRQVQQQHGADVAVIWAMGEAIAAHKAETQRLIEESVRPYREQNQSVETAHAVTGLFDSVASLKYQDGTDAYPELRDHQSAEAIARIWTQLGLPPEAMLTANSVHLAVLAYRHNKEIVQRFSGNPQPQPPAVATSQGQGNGNAGAGPGIDPAVVQAAAAAVNGGTGSLRPAPVTGPDADVASLKRKIREAGVVHPVLGFGD